jgi:hypothetical protein
MLPGIGPGRPMMKKKVKKLVLAKETLRELDSRKLEGVAGAISEDCPTTSAFIRCWGTLACTYAVC